MNGMKRKQPPEPKLHRWDERRLAAASRKFREATGRIPTFAFSSPGRTELGGNHTDHHHGKVLAASIDLDMLASAAPRSDGTVRVFSEGFKEPFIVQVGEGTIRPSEKGTSAGLIRGILAIFTGRGHEVGGFDAWVTSRVGVGSGLSSSACFEVLIGSILNTLYNRGRIPPLQIAAVGQAAENEYFGKPCGLMDQVACSVGGALKIDFRVPDKPEIKRLQVDPREFGFDLLVVNTGSSHEDLTAEYASIPEEMRSVARLLGFEYCRDVPFGLFIERLPEVRARCGDRAALRCMHFFGENERVEKQFTALKKKKFADFLALVQQSGDSSIKFLQNIYSTNHPQRQSVTLALAQTERFLSQCGGGACRVHGGGFAGTIQVYLPSKEVGKYRRTMASLFGRDCVQPLVLRPQGVTARAL
jgi:galactokinase